MSQGPGFWGPELSVHLALLELEQVAYAMGNLISKLF